MRTSPMLEMTREEIAAELRAQEGGATDEQIDTMHRVHQRLLELPEIRGYWGGEIGSPVAAHAAWQTLFGYDHDLEGKAADFDSARAKLYGTVIGAVLTGMSESEAARRSGLDRMTVRRLLGKR